MSIIIRPALLGLVLAWSTFASAQGTARLEAVAKLWSDVRWTHPALADDSIDWDRALVDALPDIDAAADDAALAQAIGRLMAPLHDPQLRIGTAEVRRVAWPDHGELIEWLDDGTALLHLHPGMASLDEDDGKALQQALHQLAKAKRIVIDLRAIQPSWNNAGDVFDDAVSALIDQPLLLPAESYRFATNPRPRNADYHFGLYGGKMTLETGRIAPAGTHAVPLAFIVNELDVLPKAALALQHAGKAVIVTEGGTNIRTAPGQRMQVEGVRVEYSAAELVFADGKADFKPDLALPRDASTGRSSPTVLAAAQLLVHWRSGTQAIGRPSAAMLPIAHQDQPHRDMPFPDLAWRRLAAIKLWSTIDAFYPYKDLLDTPWNQTLADGLERMRTARNAEEYSQGLALMAAKLDDSHVFVHGKAFDAFIGAESPGLRLDMVEGKVLVTGFDITSLAGQDGLKIGSQILLVDGQDVDQLLAAQRPYMAGSTEASRQRTLVASALFGADGSKVKLVFTNDGTDRHETELVRRRQPPPTSQESHAAYEVLPGNIGYVDLGRLEAYDAPAMFKAMQHTQALIFDMRGYPPPGTVWRVASWLNVNKAKTGALIYQNFVTSQPETIGKQLALAQQIPPARQSPYQGKAAMLVDAHTQNLAEHAGLLFEAAAPVTFIGTPTAGSNGEVRGVSLPGGITVSFSSRDVRHADGRRLQRVGIQPDVLVAPTVAGIRAGRDEVLERALTYMREAIATKPGK